MRLHLGRQGEYNLHQFGSTPILGDDRMLVCFSAENFRSIKARQALHMSAVKTCMEWETESVAKDVGLRMLRSVVI